MFLKNCLSRIAQEEISLLQSLYPDSFFVICEKKCEFAFQFTADFVLEFILPPDYPESAPPIFTLHVPISADEAKEILSLQLLKTFSVQGCLLKWFEFLRQQAGNLESPCICNSTESTLETTENIKEPLNDMNLVKESGNVVVVGVQEDYHSHHRDISLELLVDRVCLFVEMVAEDKNRLISFARCLLEQLGVLFLETGLIGIIRNLLESQSPTSRFGICRLDRLWYSSLSSFRHELPGAPEISCKLKQLVVKAKSIAKQRETFHAIVVVSEICVQILSNFLSVFIPECMTLSMEADLSGNARRTKMTAFRQKKKAAILVVSKQSVYTLPLTFAEYIFWLEDADENVFASFPPEVKIFVFSSKPLDLQSYFHCTETSVAEFAAPGAGGRLSLTEELLTGEGSNLDSDEATPCCENFKSSLQRLMLSRMPGTHPSELIKYNTLEFKHCTHRPLNSTGSRQLFVSNVTLPSLGLSFSGEAHPTKKQAEQSAANAALSYLREGSSEQPPHDYKGELNRLASQHFRTLVNIIRYETYTLPTRTPMFQSTVTIIPYDIALQGDVQETKKRSQQSAAKKVVESWKVILQAAAAQQPLSL